MGYKGDYREYDENYNDNERYEDYDDNLVDEGSGEYKDECKDDYKDAYKNDYKDDYKDDYRENFHKKLIEVDSVIGVGSGETFVEVCIPLCPPAFEVMEALIEKKVIFDALVAGKDKVFVNGRLIKDIPFKTKCEVMHPGCDKISKLVFGNVKHVTAEIPFALCIKVPGSEKGGKVVVLKYEVNSVEILNHLRCSPNSCVSECEPAFMKEDACLYKPIRSITEKDCISVKVKVVKPVIIRLPHKPQDKY